MAGSEQPPPTGLPATTFFSKTYDEAFVLLVEARNYVRDRGPTELKELDLDDRFMFSSESMRLTTRVSEIMAWLLLQRALHEGEVTIEEVRRDSNRLIGSKICMTGDEPGLQRLPPRLRVLLERSDRLYRRVMRLDELVMRDTG